MSETVYEFPVEFGNHFQLCNRFQFEGIRTKRLFYKLKSDLLKRYGRLIGYDLQTFSSWDCDRCEFRVNDKEMLRCRSRPKCGGDWAGTHQHICARYGLYLEPEPWQLFSSYPRALYFHVPTDEYAYKGRVHQFESSGFKAMREKCLDRIGVKDELEPSELVNPWESFKWLIRYCRTNGLIPKRERQERAKDLF